MLKSLFSTVSAALGTLLFGLLIVIFTPSANAASIDDLDRILTQSPDLAHFLYDPKLVNEYYQASVEYYGSESRFPRLAYDAILQQMRTVSTAFPDFARRSWETNLGEAFSVQSSAPTFARKLDETLWEEFFEKTKEDLRTEAGDLNTMANDQVLNEINARLARVSQLVAQHANETSAQGLKKADLARANGLFFQGLKTNSELHRISAFLLLKTFESPHGKEVFESGSSDFILNEFKEMKDQPKLILNAFPGLENAELLSSVLKQKTPDAVALMKETEIFPKTYITTADGKKVQVDAGSAGEWLFRPAPRRFHAFFKGLYFAECVGGSVKPDFFPGLTPERWATVILKDTQFHFIEKDGRFQGWVQAVPVKQGADTYASIDLASHAFRQSILQKRSDGTMTSQPMLAGWLREAMKHKPAHWRGFVVSQSNAINNGGALPTVRSMPGYILGEKFDPATRPFAHADPQTVQVLTNIIPLVGYGKTYGGSMIFDASVPDAKTLTALKITDRSLYDIFRQAISKGQKDVVTQMIEQIHNGAMSDIGNEIITLREAGVLRMLAANGYKLPNKVVYWSIEPVKYVKTLIDAGLSLEEMKSAQKLMSYTVQDSIAFTKALLASSLVKDGASFVAAIEYEQKVPSEAYRDALALLIRDSAPGLTKRLPNVKIADLVKLELLTKSIEAGAAVLREGVPVIKTKQELFELFDGAHVRGNEAYKKSVNASILACRDWFFKQNPSADDVIRFGNFSSELWAPEQVTKFIVSVNSRFTGDSLLKIGSGLNDKKLAAQLTHTYAIAMHETASTVEEKQRLEALHEQSLPNLDLGTGWKTAYAHKVKLAPDAAGVVAELTRFHSATGTYRTAVAEVTASALASFLQMNPTREQVMTLLRSGVLFQKDCLTLTQVALKQSHSVADYVDALTVRHKAWSTADYAESRIRLVKETQLTLKSLPDFAQSLASLSSIEELVPGTSGVIEDAVLVNLSSRIAVASSAQDIRVSVTEVLTIFKGAAMKHKIFELMRNQHGFFLELKPSKDDLSWYNSAFLKLHERIGQKFMPKSLSCARSLAN